MNDLQKYTVYIQQNTQLSWQQRNADTFEKICIIANKVVELKGVVVLDKNFNTSYLNNHIRIKIPKTALHKIRALPEVKNIK